MPPALVPQKRDDPFEEIAYIVLASVHRLRDMASAMEAQIRPGEMKAAELSRAVRTAAHLHTLVIKEGGKVAGDVRALVKTKKKVVSAD